MRNNILSPCAMLARRHDRDRFLGALLLPEACREHAFALLAFNSEISRIPDLVHEPLVGRIRFAWWREALDEIYAGKSPRAHEVLVPLAAAIREHRLPRPVFERMLDAREGDLTPAVPADMAQLEAYAGATSSALLALILQVAGVSEKEALPMAASPGIAWAMTNLLRAYPRHLRYGRLTIPADLLMKHSLQPKELLTGKWPDAMPGLVEELVNKAEQYIKNTREFSNNKIAATRFIHYMSQLAAAYLKHIRKHGYDLRHPALEGHGLVPVFQFIKIAVLIKFYTLLPSLRGA
jgi:phytoene synthase